MLGRIHKSLSAVWHFEKFRFLWWKFSNPSQLRTGGLPTVNCLQLLILHLFTYYPI